MSQTFRTFVAIELPESLQKKAGRVLHKYQQWSQYRWVQPGNMHLTLSFLGDVPQQDVAGVCRKLEEVIRPFPSIHINVRGLGAFPKPDRPRIVWLGIGEGTRELIELQGSIAATLESLGFDRDRNKFHPHVTLGRLRKQRRFDDELIDEIDRDGEMPLGEFTAREVIVFASFLEKEGPSYTPMARIRLGEQ